MRYIITLTATGVEFNTDSNYPFGRIEFCAEVGFAGFTDRHSSDIEQYLKDLPSSSYVCGISVVNRTPGPNVFVKDVLRVMAPHWAKFPDLTSFGLEFRTFQGDAADWMQMTEAVERHLPTQQFKGLSFSYLDDNQIDVLGQPGPDPALDRFLLVLATRALGHSNYARLDVYGCFLEAVIPRISQETVSAICQTVDLCIALGRDDVALPDVLLRAQFGDRYGIQISAGPLITNLPWHDLHNSMIQLFTNNQSLRAADISGLGDIGYDLSETLNAVAISSIRRLTLPVDMLHRCPPPVNGDVDNWKKIWANNFTLVSLAVWDRSEYVDVDASLQDDLPVYLKVVMMHAQLNAAGRNALFDVGAATQDWVTTLLKPEISQQVDCTYSLLRDNPHAFLAHQSPSCVSWAKRIRVAMVFFLLLATAWFFSSARTMEEIHLLLVMIFPFISFIRSFCLTH